VPSVKSVVNSGGWVRSPIIFSADRKEPCGTQEIRMPARRTTAPVAASGSEWSGRIGKPAACETLSAFSVSVFQSFLP
jgi:hypothetical protein